ncbi:tRNA wybutosine-synthesizing protein 2 homolog [Protopterus annectens]|uniref:tRNA wybutosine-synthesizing protein 2 homolog n=1 Tax=Protopterus annectens TaxID=7888 RepID=UPI001CFC3945|nr:tRNA wybutosine-synthesizing protein 2 homolog [Protopterus annectens]
MKMELEADTVPVIVTEGKFAQQYRKYLEKKGYLDKNYRLHRLPDGCIAVPVFGDGLYPSLLQELTDNLSSGHPCYVTHIKNLMPSKKSCVQSLRQKLEEELKCLVQENGGSWNSSLGEDLNLKWKRHGDLIILSEKAFQADTWKNLGPEVWEKVAQLFGAKRIAIMGRVSGDGFRTPFATLLLGKDGWVHHTDNGIRYTFDVTKCMFSFGNITEKLRVSSLNCSGEVVVDLYAGIGYFTLPYLLHARASFVHACEWNPHAVEALKRNLELNGVSDHCWIHEGDNRKVLLCDVADRVNLGLIPSSEEGWPIACQVLRRDCGGILHIHQNVTSEFSKDFTLPSSDLGQQENKDSSFTPHQEAVTAGVTMDTNLTCTVNLDKLHCSRKSNKILPAWQQWAESTKSRISRLLFELHGIQWRTNILHIEHVKSYAPHIDHIVLDLECRPAEVE